MQFSLKFSINLQLGEIQKHKSCEARCAVPKGFELDPILSAAPIQPQGKTDSSDSISLQRKMWIKLEINKIKYIFASYCQIHHNNSGFDTTIVVIAEY